VTALYLLPDLALFAVLLRMIFLGLHERRRAEFILLFAWLLWALLSISPGANASLHLVVWIFAAPAIVPAARRAGRSLILPVVLALAGGYAQLVFARYGNSFEIAAFVAHVWISTLAGTTFLLAWRKDRDKLRLGLGVYFAAAGAAQILMAALALPLLAILSAVLTGIWTALAAALGPRPDALVNEDYLGICPSSHLEINR